MYEKMSWFSDKNKNFSSVTKVFLSFVHVLIKVKCEKTGIVKNKPAVVELEQDLL